MHILVFGLGQSMRGDDAAGLAAVRLWQTHYPRTATKVNVELSELPGLDLLDRLEDMQAAILVDAVHSAAAPGTLILLNLEDLASFSADTQSAHGWGIAETLALGRLVHPELTQCRLILTGIVGVQFDLGTELSPAVQAALPEAAALIEKEVQGLLEFGT
jgi:hydrogenase maturation protease